MGKLDAALQYAAMGWQCYPARLDKRPAIDGWNSTAATDNPETLTRWFAGDFAGANIGVATGLSKLVALDIDAQHDGLASFNRIAHEVGPEAFEGIPENKTPRGGFHLIFDAPSSRIASSQGALGTGIDVRAEGGGILLPPSRTKYGLYNWKVPLEDTIMRVLPDAIVELLRDARRKSVKNLLPNTIERGQRNAALAICAGRLRRLGHTESEILPMLQAVNQERCKPPLPELEVRAIAASIAKREGSVDPQLWLSSWLPYLRGNAAVLAIFYAGLAERLVPEITPAEEQVLDKTRLSHRGFSDARTELKLMRAIEHIERYSNGRKIAPKIELLMPAQCNTKVHLVDVTAA